MHLLEHHQCVVFFSEQILIWKWRDDGVSFVGMDWKFNLLKKWNESVFTRLYTDCYFNFKRHLTIWTVFSFHVSSMILIFFFNFWVKLIIQEFTSKLSIIFYKYSQSALTYHKEKRLQSQHSFLCTKRKQSFNMFYLNRSKQGSTLYNSARFFVFSIHTQCNQIVNMF